jgi:primary-amine oxidase
VQSIRFAQETSMISFTRRCLTLSALLCAPLLSAQVHAPAHPLDGLNTDEYWAAHDALFSAGHLGATDMVASLLLHEPEKQFVLSWKPGDTFAREADAIVIEDDKTYEARIDLKARKVESWKQAAAGMQGPVTMGEMGALDAVAKKDERVLKALKAHGITDLSTVRCGAGPISFLVFPEQKDHRIGWGACTDTHGAYHSWGRTVEGIYILADMTSKKILQVIDQGPIPMPNDDTNFEEADATTPEGTKPFLVMQPLGPSYTLNKGEVSWQNWRFRFRLDPRVGPIVSLVGFQDHDKLRSVMYEGSLSEMYVPYMDPDEGWNSRAFLDAGEFLLGGLIKPVGPDDCPR